MAKTNFNDTLTTAINIVLLIIAILLLLFIADKYNLYSIGGDRVITTTEYVPAPELSCTDYDIPQEYRYAYGNPAIDATQTGCLNVGGIYVEQYSELSCHWHPEAFLIDCTQAPQVEFGRFCRNELKGTYVCDAGIAYFGCHCNRPIPNEWTPPEEEDQSGDEEIDSNNDGVIETFCADVVLPQYGDLGGLCRYNGWCDAPALSCEHYWHWNSGTHLCGCLDGIYCGQYCYEYWYDTCSCPPGSVSEIVTRSTIQCVPEGKSCFEGNVV